MAKKPNIKIYLGYKYQVTKISIDVNGEDPDAVEEVKGPAKKGSCMTKPVNIYNVASVKANVKALKEELEHKFMKSLQSLSGSNWSIKRFDSMYAVAHTLSAARGGSYLPTPAKLSNPKCGLINIQNHDQECV